MQLIRNIEHLKNAAELYLAIGVFDGVHLGHREVIRHALRRAKQANDSAMPGVLTFDPHPIRLLAPKLAPRRILASLEHKRELLEEMSVGCMIVQDFNQAFAAMTGEAFIKSLVEVARSAGGRLASVAVGEDWTFGKGKSGNVEVLRDFGSKYGFEVDAVQPVMHEGERISSTRIRQALRDGNIEAANTMLGWNYTVVGTVIEGRQLARKLGFPTANVVAHNELLPKDGVWSLRVKIGSKKYRAIGNLGRRPTVELEGARRLLEVHLFDFEGDLYGQDLECEFIDFVRGEKVFDSLEELRSQISKDVALVLGSEE